MEKNIEIRMSFKEAKEFETYCQGIQIALARFIEMLPHVEAEEEKRVFQELALRTHLKNLEKVASVFRTTS